MQIVSLIVLSVVLAYTKSTQYKLRFAFCNQAPNPALQIVCSQLHKWDSVVREHHSSTITSSRSSWSSSKIWSNSRSRWSSNSQGWSAWSSWASAYSSRGGPQQAMYPPEVEDGLMLNNSHYPALSSFRKSVIPSIASVFGEPKRVEFEIQYEISSVPGQKRTRGGQVTNVKTYTRTASTSAKREQEFLHSERSFSHPMPSEELLSGLQGPLPFGTSGKDLYAMEQETVGPPGQQRPNNLMHNPPAPLPPPPRTSSIRATGSPALPSELHDHTPNKKIHVNMATPPLRIGEMVEERKNAFDCMDLNCLCPFFHGRLLSSGCYLANDKKLSMAVRKEYRQLGTEERLRFHTALEKLKLSGEYDKIAQWHTKPEMSGGAHSGPAFLPWHREYIKRFEIALRLLDPDVSLPYWDSTLESLIPESVDTILFSTKLMGENDKHGTVINGFASHWVSHEGHRLIRRPGEQGRPLNENDIQAMTRHSDITDVLAYTAPQQGCRYQMDWTCIEYSHANALIWVGGDMFQQTTSANDPLFFLHHAFVDSIWEYWRQHRQSYGTRSKAYPPDLPECSSANHFAQSLMQPFAPLKNIDGISNDYTARLYRYAPRPTCPSGRDEQCGSEWLFCDSSHGYARCSAKIRVGGNCSGYNRGEKPCYNGVCQLDRCTKNDADKDSILRTRSIENAQEGPAIMIKNAEKVQHEGAFTSDQCYNAHECCSVWAQRGGCFTNERNMAEWCPASCNKCTPTYDINSECLDRHTECSLWAGQDECDANRLWMAENCRSSCRRCHVQRSDACAAVPYL